jgi:hypothetical protein
MASLCISKIASSTEIRSVSASLHFSCLKLSDSDEIIPGAFKAAKICLRATIAPENVDCSAGNSKQLDDNN